MVRLRFQRVGRPHVPHFRLVAIPRAKARDAAALEVIGHYHPLETEKVSVNSERLSHWLKVGAQPSDTVRTVLSAAGLFPAA